MTKKDSDKVNRAKKKSKKEDLEQELGELTQDLQRIQADFINYKRRSEEEAERRFQAAQRSVVAALLPTLDNVERALLHLPDELKNNEWAIGVAKTAESMFESLRQLGIEKIEAEGTEFDPEIMDAVQMEDEGGDKEIVSEVIQNGYRMNEEVIRHAVVKVKRSK